jgi:LysM repeat protein
MKTSWGTGTDMTRRGLGIAAALLLLGGATQGWCDQFYRYAPTATADGNHASGEILVREIQVQKGDTLYGLSRRFAGHGAYYPQILLFNDIKDPDKIYAGSTLRLPVTSTALPAPPAPVPQKAVAAPPPVKVAPPATRHAKAAAPAAVPSAPQGLYEQAVGAYRRNDCPAAVELFDRFLAADPSSPLAADAALFKADCFLKQSGQ